MPGRIIVVAPRPSIPSSGGGGSRRREPTPIDTSRMSAGQLADYIKSKTGRAEITPRDLEKYAPEAVAKARAIPAFTGVVRETGAGQPGLIKTYEAGKLISVTEAPKVLPPKVEALRVGEEKLKLGEKAITAYQPFTKEEISKQKELESIYGKPIIGEATKFEKFRKEEAPKFLSYVTSLRDVIIDAFTGQKAEQAYVPTTKELLKKGKEVSYYTRPTMVEGKIVVAGTPIVATGKPTAGEKFAVETIQEDVRLMNEVDFTSKQVIYEQSGKAQNEIDAIFNDVQDRVSKGTISVERGNRILATEQEIINTKYNKIANEDFSNKLKYIEGMSDERRKELEKDYKKAIALSIGQKVVAGGLSIASWTIPFAGPVLKVADITKMSLEAPELATSLYKEPLATITDISPYIAGGMIAGGAIAGLKGKYVEEPKIREAIDKSYARTKYIDITKEGLIKQLTIDATLKQQLKTQLDMGNIIRSYTTNLVAKSTAHSKYLPKVEGKYIEVLTRDGRLLERINLGKVVSEYQKKVYSNYAISHALGKLEGDTAVYYTRTAILAKAKPSLREPIVTSEQARVTKYYETLEKVQLKESKRFGRIFGLKGEAEVKILKEIEKPKPSDITKLYKVPEQFKQAPTEQINRLMLGWKKAKAYGKAEIEYIGGVVKGEVTILKRTAGDVSSFLIGTKKTIIGKGRAVFERVLPKEKVVKPMKPFQLTKPEAKRVWSKSELKYWKKRYEAEQKAAKITKKQIILKPPTEKEYPRIVTGEPTIGVSEYIKRGTLIQEEALGKLTAKSLTPEVLTYKAALLNVPEMAKQKPFMGFVVPEVEISVKEKQRQQQRLKQQLVIKTELTKVQEKLQEKTQQKFLFAQPQVSAQQQRQVQQQLQRQLQIPKLAVKPIGFPKIEIPKIKIPIYFEYKKQKQQERKQRKAQQKRYINWQRKYQASVAAVSLGITISPKKAKKLKKRFIGTEIRPIILSNNYSNYSKRLNKAFAI